VGAGVGVWGGGTANSVGVDGTVEIAWQAAVNAAKQIIQTIGSARAKTYLKKMICFLKAISTVSYLSSN